LPPKGNKKKVSIGSSEKGGGGAGLWGGNVARGNTPDKKIGGTGVERTKGLKKGGVKEKKKFMGEKERAGGVIHF